MWAGALSDSLDAAIIGSATARGRLNPLTGALLTATAASAVAAAVVAPVAPGRHGRPPE
jgi:hypothetical protein